MKIKKIILLINFFLFSIAPILIYAQDTKLPTFNPPDIKVSIPGSSELQKVTCDEGNICNIPWLGQYIGGLQRYAIGIIGIMAVIVLMMGGVMWLTAAGNSGQVGEAKKLIAGSLVGLFLVFGSYIILYLINPNLTVMKSLRVGYINKLDLEEIKVDVAELNKNLGEPLVGGSVSIPVGNYCGCFNFNNYNSTNTLTSAAAINSLITSLQPNSPLKTMGQEMLNAANKYNINPSLIIIKAKRENSLGTANSTVIQKMKNIGSIKCSVTAGCKEYSCDTAKNGIKYRTYNTWAEAIDDYFCFMKNSKTGSSPTLREMLAKYCPPCTQKDGCCYTSDYIDDVVSTMKAYNSASFDFDKVNGNNCNCYDLVKHCTSRSAQYCTK